MKSSNLKMFWILVFATAIAVASCGGDSEQTDGGGETASTAEDSSVTSESPSTDSTVTTSSTEDEGAVAPPDAPEPGKGIIVLGGVTYEFDLSTQCQIQDGSMAVRGDSTDGADTDVEGIFPAEDVQDEFGPPHLLIVFGESDTWIAEEGYEPISAERPGPDQSAVTQIELAGSTVSGEALFWETGTYETRPGSFAFTCP